MVTASHNPKEYDGFKISFSEIGNAYGPYIQDFYQYCLKKQYKKGNGTTTNLDIKESYLDYFASSINLKNKNLKVVVDCGNGVGSIIIKDILDRLGLTYYLLYCESDGTFPNHQADPSVEANLTDLKKKVVELGYDLGIGIDGDADRVAIVSEKGEYVQADLYLLFMARYLKNHLNQNKVLFDVKCSRALTTGLEDEKINGVMYRTGNSYLNMKMKEGNFSFGGEYSGHIFYRDKWAGFDDGIYAGMRFVEMLADTKFKVSELLANVRKYYSVFYEVRAGENGKREVVEKVKDYAHKHQYKSIELDGIRIEFEHSWGLIRFSNTGPNLTIRFEADSKEELEKIRNELGVLVDNLLKEVKE
jgi:phosphomannomutase/phosphoglucomutase